VEGDCCTGQIYSTCTDKLISFWLCQRINLPQRRKGRNVSLREIMRSTYFLCVSLRLGGKKNFLAKPKHAASITVHLE